MTIFVFIYETRALHEIRLHQKMDKKIIISYLPLLQFEPLIKCPYFMWKFFLGLFSLVRREKESFVEDQRSTITFYLATLCTAEVNIVFRRCCPILIHQLLYHLASVCDDRDRMACFSYFARLIEFVEIVLEHR